MKLQKLWPLVGALCLSISAFAYGNTQNNNSTYSSSMHSSSQPGQEAHQRGTFREITPPAGPRVAHGADIFVTADFIWWEAVEEKLDFSSSGIAYTKALTVSDLQQTISAGKTVSVGKDWAPGFKVGLGLNMGHDGWDLYTQYTWLHASNTKSQKGDYLKNPQIISGYNVPYVNTIDEGTEVVMNNGDTYFSGFSENKSKWNLHFNAVNIELGRNFYLSQFLTIRPHMGLKGTWQSHDWKTTSIAQTGKKFVVATSDADMATYGIGSNKHYSVWGIGVRGGLNMEWYMSKCWSIYGDFSLSTLWTNYYKQTLTIAMEDIGIENPTSTIIVNFADGNAYKCKYIAELELGFRWETWLYDDNYHFAIQAGLEQQTWINWSVLNPYNQCADMSLRGLNLKLRFDF